MQLSSQWEEDTKGEPTGWAREYTIPFTVPAGMRPVRRSHIVVAVFSLFGFIWWLSSGGFLGSHDKLQARSVYNSTLGFQKTFVISMAARTDRHDNFAMAASFTGIDFEFSEGVNESTISPNSIPPNWKKKEPGAYGCRRAHLNILQKMVRERIQSALILEDDADFDINLKQQLSGLSQGLLALQPVPDGPLQSPYGNDWDMLWLGYCMTSSGRAVTKFFITENDPTVAPIPKRHALYMDPRLPPDTLVNDTRLTFETKGENLCTYGLAFSYRGARTALAALTQKPRPAVIDYSYQELCKGTYEGVPLKCFATYPPLFGSHRPRGSSKADTDMERIDYVDSWHEEYSFDMVYSTKINMKQLAKNNGMVKAQWPDFVKEPYRKFGTPHHTGKTYVKEVDLRKAPEKTVKGINNFPGGGWNIKATSSE